jgi:perosamine synthetase
MSRPSIDRIVVPGAPASRDEIALSSPNIGLREQELVAESVRSGWLAYGPFVEEFEKAIESRLGVGHAVALSSGTAALHLALILAGVEPDDEVVTSTLSFVAPANAIRYVNATPVFIDAERDFLQMDVDRLQLFFEKRCEQTDRGLLNKETGRRIAAVVPVHILGHPADLDAVCAVSAEYGLPVIEDAAEGLGARMRGRPVGALGGIACLSFNGNKILTTAGGGALVTDDDAFADRARYLATQAKDDPLEYIHGAVGFNYRMSNLHAALGCAQLERLDEFVASKRRIADRYVTALADVPGLTFPKEAEWAFSTYWMFTILVAPGEFGMDGRELMHRLFDLGIQARPLWQPLHRSPAHFDPAGRACPVADRLHAEGLSLPCSTSLTDEEQNRVIEAILDAGGR